MAKIYKRFPESVKKAAFARQKKGCGLCGALFTGLKKEDAKNHKFGENAEAHHIAPNGMAGPPTLPNCIILCRACHFTAHGGKYDNKTLYEDFHLNAKTRKVTSKQISQISRLYPNYSGKKLTK